MTAPFTAVYHVYPHVQDQINGTIMFPGVMLIHNVGRFTNFNLKVIEKNGITQVNYSYIIDMCAR